MKVGKKSADERVDTWVPQQQKSRTNRPLLLHNQLLLRFTLVVLKLGNTCDPGVRRAGRRAGPPDSSRYSHHCGNCGIHCSSVEVTDTRLAVVRAGVRCGHSPVRFSDALNASSYPFRLFAQETKHKLSSWSGFTPSR